MNDIIRSIKYKTRENKYGKRYDVAEIWIGDVPFSTDLMKNVKSMCERLSKELGVEIQDCRGINQSEKCILFQSKDDYDNSTNKFFETAYIVGYKTIDGMVDIVKNSINDVSGVCELNTFKNLCILLMVVEGSKGDDEIMRFVRGLQ